MSEKDKGNKAVLRRCSVGSYGRTWQRRALQRAAAKGLFA